MGYGIPKSKKGLLPWKWAEQRLKRSHNYWLTTVRPDGRPHVMVIWGLWLEGAFWFSTGAQSRKSKNLAGNPNCVVCTEDAAKAVIVEGVAERVTAPKSKKPFFTLYERKYEWDMSAMQSEPVYRVRPQRAFALDESDFAGKATKWEFA
jgi:pyridoxine/pyridoxamine 5'-phosphate oxidase